MFVNQFSETSIPCPAHACTKEMLECDGELAIDENGCKLCECAGKRIIQLTWLWLG